MIGWGLGLTARQGRQYKQRGKGRSNQGQGRQGRAVQSSAERQGRQCGSAGCASGFFFFLGGGGFDAAKLPVLNITQGLANISILHAESLVKSVDNFHLIGIIRVIPNFNYIMIIHVRTFGLEEVMHA